MDGEVDDIPSQDIANEQEDTLLIEDHTDGTTIVNEEVRNVTPTIEENKDVT